VASDKDTNEQNKHFRAARKNFEDQVSKNRDKALDEGKPVPDQKEKPK
jgi:hypothetical protein